MTTVVGDGGCRRGILGTDFHMLPEPGTSGAIFKQCGETVYDQVVSDING